MKKLNFVILLVIYSLRVMSCDNCFEGELEFNKKMNLLEEFGLIIEGTDIRSLGGHSGGGGEVVAMEFVSLGYDIYIDITAKPIRVDGFNTNDFLNTLRSTKVIGRVENLFDFKGEEVDALNFPELATIIVNEKSWKEKIESHEIKRQLVFHEYLGIMANNDPNSIYSDNNYQVSSFLDKKVLPPMIDQGHKSDVDIIFVIDNSGSMQTFQEKLKNNIDILLSSFYPRKPHVGVLTSESYTARNVTGSHHGGTLTSTWGMSKHFGPFSSSAMEYLKESIISVGTHGSPTEMFYGPVINAFLDQNNSSFFRKNAELIIIFLTDEYEQTAGLDNNLFLKKLSHHRDLSKVSIYPLVPFEKRADCLHSLASSVVMTGEVKPQYGDPKFTKIVNDPRLKNGKLYNICKNSWHSFKF